MMTTKEEAMSTRSTRRGVRFCIYEHFVTYPDHTYT